MDPIQIGEMLVVNPKSKVWINDFQTLFAGVGHNLTKVRLIIAKEDTQDIEITVTDSGSRDINNRTVKFEDIIKMSL